MLIGILGIRRIDTSPIYNYYQAYFSTFRYLEKNRPGDEASQKLAPLFCLLHGLNSNNFTIVLLSLQDCYLIRVISE